MRKPLNAWFLILLPAILFWAGILYLRSTGNYFLTSVDPEYAYLFNGALFADLKLKISYILHPGTPLIILTAGVIRIVHAFRPGEDMLTDVIRNPELYIKAIIYTINLLSMGMLLLLGVFTYKKTRNIWLSVFLQLIPFAHSLALETMARVIPESLMLSLICLWIIQIISMFTHAEPVLNVKKHSLVMGILFGLSVALKLTLLPLILMPLIVLTGWRNKLRFVVVSLFSFSVFAFPVLLKYNMFYSWVKNIIIHTGSYGGGDRGILHWNEFFGHLKFQADKSPFLIISLSILLISLFIYITYKKPGIQKDKLKINLSVALILVVIFQFIITAKHYAFHYMLPAILLTLPMIVLSAGMMREIFPSALTLPRLKVIAAFLGLIVLVYIIPRTYSQTSLRTDRNKSIQESYIRYKVDRFSGPLIIGTSYYGCSAVEYALTFGIQESGKYSPYLYDKVNRIYPSIWLYFPWGKAFYAGNKTILPSAFLMPDKKYNLYIADYSIDRYQEIIKALKQNEDSLQFTITKVYVDSSAMQGLFVLQTEHE
jgi:hypothetical protein